MGRLQQSDVVFDRVGLTDPHFTVHELRQLDELIIGNSKEVADQNGAHFELVAFARAQLDDLISHAQIPQLGTIAAGFWSSSSQIASSNGLNCSAICSAVTMSPSCMARRNLARSSRIRALIGPSGVDQAHHVQPRRGLPLLQGMGQQ
jgi:hypothetical protein